MEQDQIIFVAIVFGTVVLVMYFVTMLLMNGGQQSKLRERLTGAAILDVKNTRKKSLKGWLVHFGQAAAEPFMPKKRETQSQIRQQLGYAGLYNPSAMKMVSGFKVIFTIAGVTLGYGVGLLMKMPMLGFAVGGLIGYMAPKIWLRRKISANQKALRFGLPDALDLMVVCVEAGLTVDSAMQRVGTEMAAAHPAISRELGIANMETRVGLPRSEALRNLGVRTGAPALQSLSAMLIQAERFGTSIAQALRVHADTLRVQRQLAAEELAAKASVKLSFPLVLFIFPATFIVLLGPTVMSIMKSSLFTD